MNVISHVGTATVAQTKQTNTSEIFVYYAGNFPTAEGQVSLDVQRAQKEAQDANGNSVKTDVLFSNKMVPATWKAIGEPNRLTPPDVREGSQVALYRLNGSNKYYWTTDGFSAETHRLETIVYGWNASPEINKDTDFDIKSFYTMTISTRDGMVSLRNSNANGEKSIMELAANFMEGRFVVSGAQNNQFVFDDVDHSFSYKNAEGSLLLVQKQNIMAYAKGNISAQALQDITIVAGQNLLIQAANVGVKVDGETHIYSPTTQHFGDMEIDGGLKVTKDIESAANVRGAEGVFEGDLQTGKHIHGNGNNGDDTYGPKMP